MIVFEGYGVGFPKVGDVITWGTREYNFRVESIDDSGYNLSQVNGGHKVCVDHGEMAYWLTRNDLVIL